MEEAEKEMEKKSDKILWYSFIILIIIVAIIIIVPKYINPVVSVDELHKRNFEGKLNPDEGYLYNGYSFVFHEGLWNTQIQSRGSEAKLFDIKLHYGPREVEHIQPQGFLNKSNLDKYLNFFNTFNPEDDDLGFIAAATSEANFVLTQVFGKGVIGSCTKQFQGCEDRPIVECDSTDAPVLYYASEEDTNLLYLNNCVIISGSGDEIFKSTDRLLYDLMGIMN